MDIIKVTGITILAAIIGALPLGLVNLSVMHLACQSNRKAALKVAHGASWIEVLYGLLALLTGTYISGVIGNSPVVRTLAVLIPLLAGVFFLFKKVARQELPDARQGYLKGVVLNLLSVQVLLYWMVAVTWLKTHYLPELTPMLIFVFVTSLWLGKMGVLWLYARFSKMIMSRSIFLAKNINRIIGIVLIISGLIQFMK